MFALLAGLARAAFGFDALQGGSAALAVFLLGCFLTAWIVGVAVCALVMLFGTRAESSAWASVNLVLVLAGIYYPVSVLPGAIAPLSAAIPLTHFLDAYRAHFGFPTAVAWPISTGLALSAPLSGAEPLGIRGRGAAHPALRPPPAHVGVSGTAMRTDAALDPSGRCRATASAPPRSKRRALVRGVTNRVVEGRAGCAGAPRAPGGWGAPGAPHVVRPREGRRAGRCSRRGGT